MEQSKAVLQKELDEVREELNSLKESGGDETELQRKLDLAQAQLTEWASLSIWDTLYNKPLDEISSWHITEDRVLNFDELRQRLNDMNLTSCYDEVCLRECDS